MVSTPSVLQRVSAALRERSGQTLARAADKDNVIADIENTKDTLADPSFLHEANARFNSFLSLKLQQKNIYRPGVKQTAADVVALRHALDPGKDTFCLIYSEWKALTGGFSPEGIKRIMLEQQDRTAMAKTLVDQCIYHAAALDRLMPREHFVERVAGGVLSLFADKNSAELALPNIVLALQSAPKGVPDEHLSLIRQGVMSGIKLFKEPAESQREARLSWVQSRSEHLLLPGRKPIINDPSQLAFSTEGHRLEGNFQYLFAGSLDNTISPINFYSEGPNA